MMMTTTTTSEKTIQFKNCRLIRNHQIIIDDLWIRNGKIINPEPIFFEEKVSADEQIDCGGLIIAPGFIDIQINGGFGIDFANNVTDVQSGLRTVAVGLLKYGVTSFCPTLVTSTPEAYHEILPKINRTAGGDGANILGVHLEGPFISKEKKGAHHLESIQELSNGISTLHDTYGRLDNVAIITLAPEKANALNVIEELSKSNVTVALGHSVANFTQGEAAIERGSNLITHLFNAMLPFHHRDPGLVGLLTSTLNSTCKTIYYGIIPDGVHTHPSAMRIAYQTHKDGLILVTDAISALGLQDGIHYIGQMNVEVRGIKALIAGTDTLCGSIAPMDECIRIFQKSTDCPIVYALEAASLHPAKCLKIESQKGTLDFGADADLIILNDELTIRSTWIAGKCLYDASKL